jgi:beta-lactamase class A
MKQISLHKVGVVRAVTLLAVLLAGIAVGVISVIIFNNARQQQRQDKYSLLADRILLGSDKDRTVNFTQLRQEIANYIAANMQDVDYSVYFEYLPTGTSIGMDESNNLVGASLLKVPFAMQYYHALEEGKLRSDDIVTIQAAQLDDSYGELYKKGAGYQLTLDEVVRIMLIDSDNTALRVLADTLSARLGIDNIDKVFNFVDLNYESDAEGSTLIGAGSYSSILKCLYFACYVSKENSQQILTLLTQSDFNNRLKRYIPQEEMPVIAHKIGSFGKTTQSDCGIFYEPQKPYLLCIMVNSDDQTASQHIGKLSILVYEYISSLKN